MPSIPLEELLADLGLSDQEDEDDMRKTRHWKSCTCATIIFEILYIKKLLHFCGAIKISIEYSKKKPQKPSPVAGNRPALNSFKHWHGYTPLTCF